MNFNVKNGKNSRCFDKTTNPELSQVPHYAQS